MRSRTIKGTSWIVAGRFVRIPVNIVVTAVLARLLLPADFGIIAFATTLTGVATAVFDGSIGINIVRRARLEEGEIGTALVVNLAAGLLLMLAMLASAWPLERWMAMPHLAPTVEAIAFTIPISAGASVFNALLQRHNHFKALMLASLAGQLVYGALAIGLALADWGVWALAIGVIGSIVTETLLNAIFAKSLMDWRVRLHLLGKIIADGGAFTVAKLFSWGAAGFDKLAAGQLGATPLGFYSRASSLYVVANLSLGAGLMRALLSSFAQISDDVARLGRGYLRAIEVMLLISTFVTVNILLFAPEIIRALLGPGWDAVIWPLRILFVAFLARGLSSATEALTATVASNWQNVARQVAQLLLVVALVSLGVRFGIDGVAAGYAAAMWLMHAINLFAVRKWVGLRTIDIVQAHLRPMLAVVPAALAGLAFVFLVPAIGPLFRLALGGTACVAALLLTLQLAPRSWLGVDLSHGRDMGRARLKSLRERGSSRD